MTYTRLQNHTITVVGEHGRQTFKVAVAMLLLLLLSFDVFCPHKCTTLIIFGQMVCPNILICELGASWMSYVGWKPSSFNEYVEYRHARLTNFVILTAPKKFSSSI